MSLFDLEPLPDDPVAAPAPTDYLIRLKQTKSGRDILVCTAEIATAAVVADAENQGLSLFTAKEIKLMANCLPETVDDILAIKLKFPGCTVRQILDGAIPA